MRTRSVHRSAFPLVGHDLQFYVLNTKRFLKICSYFQRLYAWLLSFLLHQLNSPNALTKKPQLSIITFFAPLFPLGLNSQILATLTALTSHFGLPSLVKLPKTQIFCPLAVDKDS